MTGLGTLQMLLLAAIAFFVLSGAATSVLVAPVLRFTQSWAPARRHLALVVIGFSPLAIGLSAVVSTMLPSLLGLYWPAQDHCLAHGGHSHLCFVHASHHHGGAIGWSVIALAAAWVATRGARGARSLFRASRLVGALARSARLDPRHAAHVVASDTALCLAVGLLRPRVLVSEGLLSTTPAVELEVMFAHEREHCRRRDSLVRLLVAAASACVWLSARAKLLAALELSAEQACDEMAVPADGDRLRVAETILANERRMLSAAGLGCACVAAGFCASSVPERVAALLHPRRDQGTLQAVVLPLATLLLGVLGAHDFLHHAAESLLASVTH